MRHPRTKPTARHLPSWAVTFVVELESLLYGGDGAKHRQPVDSALDVGGGAEFISQHLGHSGNLILGRDDEGDHTGSIPEE